MFKSGRLVASNAYGFARAGGVERVAYGCNAPKVVARAAGGQLVERLASILRPLAHLFFGFGARYFDRSGTSWARQTSRIAHQQPLPKPHLPKLRKKYPVKKDGRPGTRCGRRGPLRGGPGLHGRRRALREAGLLHGRRRRRGRGAGRRGAAGAAPAKAPEEPPKEPEQLLASVALEPPTPPAPVVVSTEDLAAMAPQPVPSPEPVAKPPQPDPARTEALQAARQAEIRRRRLFGVELVGEHSRYAALDRLLGRGVVECGSLRLLVAKAVESEARSAAGCVAFARFPAEARQELGAEPAASVSAQNETTTYGVARLLAARVASEADAHEQHALKLRSEGARAPRRAREEVAGDASRPEDEGRHSTLKSARSSKRRRAALRCRCECGTGGRRRLATVQYTAGSAILARTWCDAKASLDSLFATAAATETERRSLERRCLKAFLAARRECLADH